MLADELDYVIGADTHRDAHALAVVAAASGGVLAQRQIEANGGGYAAALAFAERETGGRRAWAIEGTGSYGAGLARYLSERGERVLEVGRSRREPGRGRPKSDPLDAVRAARSVLGETKPAVPRAGGGRAALRALVTTREGAIATRRAGLNQLRALIVDCPEPLRAELTGLTRARLLARCASMRCNQRRDPQLRATRLALRACARRVQAADAEQRELAREITLLVREWAPQLLAEPGVGPISAAQLLVSWSHAGRFPSEAAFARHGGTAPIPASSGQVIRHRLNPGNDRQLNRALHTVIVSRRKHDPATIAYTNRRTSEGKSTREAIRCLKRYLARHLFRIMEAMPQAA
jgi:transposase